MTEAEWLACADAAVMQQFLDGKVTDRKARLYRCACCRHIWPALADPCFREAVEVAERYADGLVGDSEREDAHGAARAAHDEHGGLSDVTYCPIMATAGDARELSWVAETAANEFGGDTAAYCDFLRDMFGLLPFRPVTIDPAWLTPTAVALARQMYESRDFSLMPILADALQDAGCDQPNILAHCRGDGPHVRGCWVVDLVLGKS